MPLNSTTVNMAAIMRRSSQVLRSSILIQTRDYSRFRPLFSVTSNTLSDTRIPKHHDLINRQTRLANTSSGFYAPSTIATRRGPETSELGGNLNVFEDSDHLPSLPVPNLNATLEKLKESVSPVAMNSAEFVNTLRLIDEFSKSAGPKLDLLLRKKAGETKNWMTQDWWTNEAYLRSRRPLVINSNPSMVYPALPFEVNNQRALVDVISQLISGIIDFKLSLIHGYNPEATSADNECRLDPNLCYHQYKNIFGSTRLPGELIDTVKMKNTTNILENEPFSVVIAYRSKFFEVQLRDIEDEKGRIDKISGILDKIIDSSKDETEQRDGAGVLTTANRDDWARAFKLLDVDSMNAIQGAQFVVSIDTIPEDPDKFSSSLMTSPVGSDDHFAALGRQLLHGDSANVGNRWFDKSLQLIVVADGRAERLLGAGINYEHSFTDGTVITKMIEYSYDKAVQKSRKSSNSNFFAKQQVFSQEPAVFRQLKMFNESNMEKIADCLKQARQNFATQVDQFDLSYLNYKRYGSNAIKTWCFSPDSWFQVALQSAYYNLHKRLGPCYESATTRRFAYGRTETIRSLTKEVAQFCFEPRFETMQTAIQSHKSYAISASNGNAIDRALMGYKMVFNELKTNSWVWGLPTSYDGHDKHGMLKLLSKQKSDNDDAVTESNGNGIQGFSLEDLFTEEELNTIIAFWNNELINRSNKYALSTSQVSSMHPNIFMTYGPILADGYGCCYNITGQQIVAAITANSSNQSFSCEVNELSEGVENSLDKMADILEEQRSKSIK